MHGSYSAPQMSGKPRVIRPLRPHDVEHPKRHVPMKLLNHKDSPLSVSLFQNPDVWHLANIIQDLLDWEQNECRKGGSSFSESTTGNKPIKKKF